MVNMQDVREVANRAQTGSTIDDLVQRMNELYGTNFEFLEDTLSYEEGVVYCEFHGFFVGDLYVLAHKDRYWAIVLWENPLRGEWGEDSFGNDLVLKGIMSKLWLAGTKDLNHKGKVLVKLALRAIKRMKR